MEHGTPFSDHQLPKSNSGLNWNLHNNNPNPTLTNNVNMNKSTAPVQPQTSTVRKQDKYMAIANVTRIMRRILPLHTKISDDAKETIQQCVSEYISFVTREANERCQREKRKTITADDVMYAMEKLGFEDYVGPLELFINRYREFESGRGCSVRGESSSFRPAYVGNGVGFNGSPYSPHHSPMYGPTSDPTNGSVHGSSHSPPHGLAHGPTHVLVHGPAHDPINGPTHGPPPPGAYGYDMLDQSTIMGGSRYYHSGHDGSGGNGGHAPSVVNEMPFFDQYGNQYK